MWGGRPFKDFGFRVWLNEEKRDKMMERGMETGFTLGAHGSTLRPRI